MSDFVINKKDDEALTAKFLPEMFKNQRGEAIDDSAVLQIQKLDTRKTPVGGSYQMPVRLGGVWLPNEPIITVSGKKNIVESAPVGLLSDIGTIKEFISLGGYEIIVQGIILSKDANYFPEQETRLLSEMYRRNESLEILCGLTEILGINRVVIAN